ncbi:MAG TPA: hypothetical protein VEB42_02050, partial [Chitinophagaceae bacterium]|nr:hypothetical protein [Chitinophagaceae bacterium]
LASCEKDSYNKDGLPELANHYYIVYVPNNNTGVSVNRSQAALIKFPVQFYSAYVRDYDAVALYKISTAGISNPAVLGQDFNIVDKSGNVIQPDAEGRYSIVFPQAKKAMDTIYVKLLNSSVAGTRKMEVWLMDNVQEKYDVDTFSTAFKRPVEIK